MGLVFIYTIDDSVFIFLFCRTPRRDEWKVDLPSEGRWKGNPAGDTQKNYLLSSGGVEIENIRRPNKGRNVPGTTASVVKARMPEITEKCE
ncbi:hypothetical protein RUM43_012235 [Polyplax serrata]|uniref:Uncharacterized protein n=1 Tax=Polyplax serrata TaxID=468196 RepID=A0AAN8PTI9_POLSC